MTLASVPASCTLGASGPAEFLIGYAAAIEVSLTDPSTGRSLRIDPTWTLWADVFTGPGATPQRVALTGVVVTQGRGLLTLPKALVGSMTPGNPTDTTFAARAVIGYTDSTSVDHAFLEPLYLLPLDPSRVNGVTG